MFREAMKGVEEVKHQGKLLLKKKITEVYADTYTDNKKALEFYIRSLM